MRLETDGSVLQGMDYADTTTPPRQLDGSCYGVSQGFFLSLIDEIVGQLKRADLSQLCRWPRALALVLVRAVGGALEPLRHSATGRDVRDTRRSG